MTKIEINESDVGKEYLDSLVKAVKIRKDKRKQYGDTFLTDDLLFLKYQLENKLKRLTQQLENGILKTGEKHEETAIDSLIDIINYALFMLAKITRGDKK